MKNNYKLREQIDLDEWSGAHIEILVDENSHLEVRAVDLIGDAWHDHIEALAEARRFHQQDDAYRCNRALQNSLTKLMTHFDGIVSGIYKHLALPVKNGRAPSILSKAEALRGALREANGIELPKLQTDFKVIRDLLIHPYIKKTLSTGEFVPQGVVFDLDYEFIDQCSRDIDEWLGVLCKAFDHPRWYDTKLLSERYCRAVVDGYRRKLKLGQSEFPHFDELDAKTIRI